MLSLARLQLLFNGLTDLFNETNGSLHGVVRETVFVEQVLKDQLCSVVSEEMTREKLTNELNVSEQLMLTLEHGILVVGRIVRLACILCLLLQNLKVSLLLEELEVDLTAVVEELLAEVAEFKVHDLGGFTLRLEVDLDNQRADLTVEIGVGVLDLSLAEDGLHHDLKDLLVNLESISL